MGVEKRLIQRVPRIPFLSRFQNTESAAAKVEPDTETEDIVDPHATLRGLRVKVDIMSDLLRTDMVEQPAIGVTRFFVRNWFRRGVKVEEIEGLNNLRLAIAVSEATGKRIFFTPAHIADMDHTAAVFSLEKAGRKFGRIQNNLVWIGGVNMLRRPKIRRFLRSEHVIYNVTPRDMDHLQTLLDHSREYGFDDQQRDELNRIRETFNIMREEAKKRVGETCVKEQKTYVDLMRRFPPKGFYVPSEIDGKRNPFIEAKYADNKTHMIGRALLGAWMRLYHRLEVQFHPDMPKKGPVLFYTSHGGNLTTLALMVGDPFYPPTSVPIKSESFKGITGKLLRAWEAFPVNRDGKDKETVFRMMNILQEGRTVCIAAEGTRSPDGVLQPLDSSFVSFALMCAKRGYPVVPIAEPGTYRALQKGNHLPRPFKIRVIGGSPVDLSPYTSQKLSPEVKMAAAQYMQNRLADLLPPELKPRPGTKPMWDREEYLAPKS